MPRTEVRLPADPPAVQAERRRKWNDARSLADADFYTVGYSGRTIEEFIEALVAADVRTLLDIRFNPVSMYKPAFSKRNLERSLTAHRIAYLHVPDLGVPGDIRGKAAAEASRASIWLWYDDSVVPKFASRNLHWFFNAVEHPVAMMCTEIDPTACHRHRIALALERRGLTFFDL